MDRYGWKSRRKGLIRGQWWGGGFICRCLSVSSFFFKSFPTILVFFSLNFLTRLWGLSSFDRQNVHADSDLSEDVVFGEIDRDEDDSSSSSDSEVEEIVTASVAPSSVAKSSVPNVVLFIQMEYCENSTLRTCIDQGLFQDQERVWRLFRELVEGLGYIHQKVRGCSFLPI